MPLRRAWHANAWYQYKPVTNHTAPAGARLAFGPDVILLYHFDKADVILALEADFLACEPGNPHYVYDFAQKRRVLAGHQDMNRLYVVESTLSLTGSMPGKGLGMPLPPSLHDVDIPCF
jgi:hypothetical protein